MNDLPEHRRVIHGRTFPQVYRHADYAGIEYVGKRYRTDRIAGVVLAVLIGVAFALVLVHGLTS